MFYAVSLANIVILVVDEINTAFSEPVLLLQCAEKTHGYLIIKNYLTIERIASLIKGAALTHYEVLEEDMIGLREKLLDTAVRLTSRQKAKDPGGNGAVPVDHYFNVGHQQCLFINRIGHQGNNTLNNNTPPILF